MTRRDRKTVSFATDEEYKARFDEIVDRYSINRSNFFANLVDDIESGRLRVESDRILSKDEVIIDIELEPEEKEMVEQLASENGVTVSGYASVLFKGAIDGKIVVESGEVAEKPPKVVKEVVEKVVEVPVEVETEHTEYDRKFHRFIEKLEEKGYPKSVIDRYLENMLDNVCEMGRYKRGRYEEAC